MNRPTYEIAALLVLAIGIGVIVLQQLGTNFCPS